MARDAMAMLEGQRIIVQAPVLRFGVHIGWAGTTQRTVLIGPVATPDGATLAPHLWLRVGKRLEALDLHPGDVVQFSGRVARYRRGLNRRAPDGSTDVLLAYPTRCAVVARAPQPVAAAQERPAAARVRTAVAALHQAGGRPPSLRALFAHLGGIRPWVLLGELHRLAQQGAIQFQPDGRVFVVVPPDQDDQPTGQQEAQL